jgi:hypothetical protein
MLFLESCPRCSGDVNADSDTHGDFLKCLQCGFSKDLSVQMAARLLGDASLATRTPGALPDQQAA